MDINTGAQSNASCASSWLSIPADMAASKDIVANKEAISAFEPSLWGDFFVTYTSPPLQACICNFISCQHAIFFYLFKYFIM